MKWVERKLFRLEETIDYEPGSDFQVCFCFYVR